MLKKNKINTSHFYRGLYPFIISEVGINHNGNLDLAFKLIDASKCAGADCVKFQAYTADQLVTEFAPKAPYQKKNKYDKEAQYELLSRCQLNECDFEEIYQYCKKINIKFMATPFSVKWAKFLLGLGVEAFKIGSGNLSMIDMLETIGSSGLPIILSTGLSQLNEIRNSVDILKRNGSNDITILHCVSLYPPKLEQINLFVMHSIEDEFHLPVGFSDHTKEIFTGSLAVAAGAKVLEKHFTLNKQMEGPDHKMSLEPDQMKKYIKYSRTAAIICGNKNKNLSKEELAVKKIVQINIIAKTDILVGAKIDKDMLEGKRAGRGIPFSEINKVVGKQTKCFIEKGKVLTYNCLSN